MTRAGIKEAPSQKLQTSGNEAQALLRGGGEGGAAQDYSTGLWVGRQVQECTHCPASVGFLKKIFFIIYLFLRECKRGRDRREGATESEVGSRLRAVSPEPDMGLEPVNCEIMT